MTCELAVAYSAGRVGSGGQARGTAFTRERRPAGRVVREPEVGPQGQSLSGPGWRGRGWAVPERDRGREAGLPRGLPSSRRQREGRRCVLRALVGSDLCLRKKARGGNWLPLPSGGEAWEPPRALPSPPAGSNWKNSRGHVTALNDSFSDSSFHRQR